MPGEHQPAVPITIEQVVAGLQELATVLGPAGRDALPRVRSRLIEAMAARDRGDQPNTVAHIRAAMEALAAVADTLAPEDAVMMRVLADRFATALTRGDQAGAKSAAGVMFDKSGARERK